IHIRLSGIQPCAGEVGVIRSVRKHLRLKTKAVGLPVHAPTLADAGGIQEISRIELHAGRAREQLQHAPGLWIFDASGRSQLPGLAVDDEIVIVAAPEMELLIGSIANAFADGAWLAKIELRARHRAALAGR